MKLWSVVAMAPLDQRDMITHDGLDVLNIVRADRTKSKSVNAKTTLKQVNYEHDCIKDASPVHAPQPMEVV